jgi:hypothetical protein
MNKEINYTVCYFENGNRIFVKLDEGGYPYTIKDGSPFSYCNGYRIERDAKETIEIIYNHFKNKFPTLILEKWEVWVDQDDTIYTNHIIIE